MTVAATGHPNATKLREMCDRWLSGDLAGFLGYIADGIVVHAGGDNVLTGTYRGKEAYSGYLAAMAEKVGTNPQLDVDEMLAGDRHGAMILQARATRDDGATIDTKVTFAVRFGDDGLVTEWWFLPADQAAWDAFFR